MERELGNKQKPDLEDESNAVTGVDSDGHAGTKETAFHDAVHIFLHLPRREGRAGTARAQRRRGSLLQLGPFQGNPVLSAHRHLADQHPLLAPAPEAILLVPPRQGRGRLLGPCDWEAGKRRGDAAGRSVDGAADVREGERGGEYGVRRDRGRGRAGARELDAGGDEANLSTGTPWRRNWLVHRPPEKKLLISS
jgi:hypothetical protein